MSKLDKCLKILKTYGVLVDFDDECRENTGKGKANSETVAGWKKRVLGSRTESVVFYIPVEMAPQTRFKSVRARAGSSHVIRVMSQLTHLKESAFKDTLSQYC